MHSGRDQKKFAYGESPNAFGNCAHMVINIFVVVVGDVAVLAVLVVIVVVALSKGLVVAIMLP